MSQPKSPTSASSRRTFLKTTAAAAAASQLIIPQGVRAAGSEVVKFGLIGCGGRGTGAGGQALSANPSNHLTAIGDLWPEPIDRALKRLKSKLDTEGIMDEIRRLRAFETPTQRTKRKAKANAKRAKAKFRFSPA